MAVASGTLAADVAVEEAESDEKAEEECEHGDARCWSVDLQHVEAGRGVGLCRFGFLGSGL
jgi:hypothetical protein